MAGARGKGWWAPGHQWLWDREQKAEVQENEGLGPKEAMVGVHENKGWCPGNHMFLLGRVPVGFKEQVAAVQKHYDYVTLNPSLYPCNPNGANQDINAAVRPHQWLGSKTPFAVVHEELAGSPATQVGAPGNRWLGPRNPMVGWQHIKGWCPVNQLESRTSIVTAEEPRVGV